MISGAGLLVIDLLAEETDESARLLVRRWFSCRQVCWFFCIRIRLKADKYAAYLVLHMTQPRNS